MLREETWEEIRPERRVKHVGKSSKNGHEMQMVSQIRYYEMDYIILDMGFDVNILTIHTWESMGKPRLDWSPI